MPEREYYHYGYDPITDEFILWKSGRQTAVARISRLDALNMASTVLHVETSRERGLTANR